MAYRLFATLRQFFITVAWIAAFIVIVIILSYALFWGILVMGAMALIAFILRLFSPVKKAPPRSEYNIDAGRQPKGRIIEHDENE